MHQNRSKIIVTVAVVTVLVGAVAGGRHLLGGTPGASAGRASAALAPAPTTGRAPTAAPLSPGPSSSAAHAVDLTKTYGKGDTTVRALDGRHRGQTAWRATLVVVLASVMAGTASGTAAAGGRYARMAQTATMSLPNTPVGSQARWFVGAVTHWPIPTAEIKAHFDSAFLAQVPPAQLDATLARGENFELPLGTID